MSMFVESPYGSFSLLMSQKNKYKPVRLCDREEDYTRLGLEQMQPQSWENGLRTEGGEGSFEWWYTEASFEDGSSVALTFYTKKRIDLAGPAQPTAVCVLTLPDGQKIEQVLQEEVGQKIKASTDDTAVEIGESSLRREGESYKLSFVSEELRYEACFVSELPAWRPHTGQWRFGHKETEHFNWFVAQPLASVEAVLTYKGETKQLKGQGYQDHNWGNVWLDTLVNQWYMSRVTLDGVTVIAVDIVAGEAYGYKRMPVMYLAEEGTSLGGDPTLTSVRRAKTKLHTFTGKLVDDQVRITRTVPDGRTLTLELNREQDEAERSLLEELSFLGRQYAWWMGANPTYLQMSGDVALHITQDGTTTHHHQKGAWEQLFFGSDRHMVTEVSWRPDLSSPGDCSFASVVMPPVANG